MKNITDMTDKEKVDFLMYKESASRYIDDVMDNFDFEKVCKVMEFLKWKMYLGEDSTLRLPDVFDLKRVARNIFRCALDSVWKEKIKDDCYAVSTGPFVCRVWVDESGSVVKAELNAVMEDWSCEKDEFDEQE